MIPPELSRATVKSGELIVKALSPAERARALELTSQVSELLQEHVGKTRQELELTLASLALEPRERTLGQALAKLACDRAEFESADNLGAAALRAELFLEAALRRRALGPGESLDRERVLEIVAERRSVPSSRLDAELFADLRGMERLVRAPRFEAQSLLDEYELSRLQAVLLRAVKVRARVSFDSPAACRALFGKLKFRRLLYTVSRAAGDGYLLEIDGPFSLFESVTKYGLALALILPALLECARLELSAEVRWGAKRRPLVFRLERSGGRAGFESDPALPDDLLALLSGFRALNSEWTAEPAQVILDLPGSGLCVPDLVFVHASGKRVFFELMGFWSRDAVWRRVELVQAGLAEPVLFALSSRLRVSEAVLDEAEDSALYVYKATPSPRAVLSRLEELRVRGERPRPRAGKRRARDTTA